MLVKRKPQDLRKLSPNKKRFDRSELYVYAFLIESDSMQACFVIRCPGRPTTEGYTKFLCDAIGTESYNPDTDGRIFAYGTLTTSPEEDHILKNSRNYEFRGFFMSDEIDLKANGYAQLRLKAQQVCDVSTILFLLMRIFF